MTTVGIDLGTTNSAVASAGGGGVRMLSQVGGPMMPSVVCFSEPCPIVGERARELMLTSPDKVVYSSKRYLGRSVADVVAVGDVYPYELVDDERGIACARVDGRLHPAEEVAELIVRELLRRAEDEIGCASEFGVVAVPAYFDEAQREAVRQAALRAGLANVDLIDEPAAAALAHGIGWKGLRQRVLVFDLGGGTLDVSILEMFAGVYQVYALAGDGHLGGDDWDRLVMDWIAESALPEGPEDGGPVSGSILRAEAEQLKIALADEASVVVRLWGDEGREFTEAELARRSQPLLARCEDVIERAISTSQLAKGDLTDVVLVGGASRMPCVRRLVENATGLRPKEDVNPDEAVALGSAIRAAVLDRKMSYAHLVDATQLAPGTRELLFRTAVLPTFPH